MENKSNKNKKNLKNNNKNKIILIVLGATVFLVTTILVLSPFYKGPLPSSCFEYETIKDNNIVITNYKCRMIKNIKIPKEIKGKKVVKIGESSFNNNKLKSVLIPEGVTEIGPDAFMINELERLVIPKTVKKIGHGAFNDNNIKELIMMEGVTVIEGLAFSFNSLKKINLPNSIITIGSSSFSHNNLKSIKIPKNVKFIEYGAFEDNPNLYEIINKSNNAFKWDEIINSSNAQNSTKFITGSVDNICDDLIEKELCESPSVTIIK